MSTHETPSPAPTVDYEMADPTPVREDAAAADIPDTTDVFGDITESQLRTEESGAVPARVEYAATTGSSEGWSKDRDLDPSPFRGDAYDDYLLRFVHAALASDGGKQLLSGKNLNKLSADDRGPLEVTTAVTLLSNGLLWDREEQWLAGNIWRHGVITPTEDVVGVLSKHLRECLEIEFMVARGDKIDPDFRLHPRDDLLAGGACQFTLPNALLGRPTQIGVLIDGGEQVAGRTLYYAMERLLDIAVTGYDGRVPRGWYGAAGLTEALLAFRHYRVSRMSTWTDDPRENAQVIARIWHHMAVTRLDTAQRVGDLIYAGIMLRDGVPARHFQILRDCHTETPGHLYDRLIAIAEAPDGPARMQRAHDLVDEMLVQEREERRARNDAATRDPKTVASARLREQGVHAAQELVIRNMRILSGDPYHIEDIARAAAIGELPGND